MMGPLVIHGVIIHCKWPYKWVTGVVTPINGVMAQLVNRWFDFSLRLGGEMIDFDYTEQ